MRHTAHRRAVGKLGIPAEILYKPSQLSAIEFSPIRQHPRIASEILTDVPLPGPVAEIVFQLLASGGWLLSYDAMR